MISARQDNTVLQSVALCKLQELQQDLHLAMHVVFATKDVSDRMYGTFKVSDLLSAVTR